MIHVLLLLIDYDTVTLFQEYELWCCLNNWIIPQGNSYNGNPFIGKEGLPIQMGSGVFCQSCGCGKVVAAAVTVPLWLWQFCICSNAVAVAMLWQYCGCGCGPARLWSDWVIHMIHYNAAQISSPAQAQQAPGPNVSSTRSSRSVYRADSRYAPSQWETALLCNYISHRLGTNLESALAVH